MVIAIKLMGGLGNQMFQYALGRRLADERKTKLLLDVSYFQKAKHCNFALDLLNTRHDVPTETEAKTQFSLIEEKSLAYNSGIFNVPGDIMLSGYWQNPKYSESVLDILRQDFLPKNEISPDLKYISETINGENSVAVHVRGGDYKGWRKFDVATPKYYRKAFKQMNLDVENPHFFVFTNDLEYAEWILYEVDGKYPITFVRGKDWEELYLMTRCKNHIICNSSFSWWGSQLCDNPHKKIIAPKIWFHPDGKTNEHQEVNLLTKEMWLIEP